ncbi:MAG: calcium-binding protein [Rhodobacteraceae bacterium]|nr:calcium-binding protein [Paracoccaceae bacterium]
MLTLAAILGTAVLGWGLFEIFDDDSETTEDTPEEPEQPEEDLTVQKGDEGNDSLAGTDANDTLIGKAGDDTLTGGVGDDSLLGWTGEDSLLGEEGDDTLEGGYGDDTLTGGAGDDSLLGGFGFDHLFGGDGNDTLNAGDEGGVLWGEDGDDLLLNEGTTTSVLIGGDGDDTLTGRGADELVGGDGSDHLSFNGGALAEAEGTDDPEIWYSGALLNGGDGDDTLEANFDTFQTATNSANVYNSYFIGGDGADTFLIDTNMDANTTVQSSLSEALIEIQDYDPSEDTLLIETENDVGPVTVIAQGDDALVQMNGIDLMLVRDAGATLTASDINVVIG